MVKYVDGLVSIIMPTYKRSEKLIRAIKSVLDQTYTNLELLLVNDNEPDDEFTQDLKKRVKQFENDSRFRLIIQKKHINGAVARNVGIKQAKGEYVAFLDDDDWWEKEKLERQVESLSKLPNDWGGVSCKYRFFDSNKKVIGKTEKYNDGNIYRDVLFLLSDVATGTLCLRHEALDKTGYFDEKLYRHQDLQLIIEFTYHYKLKEVDEFLHCCDVSDAQNRPDGYKLIQHKKRFFYSIRSILKKMDKKDVECAYALHKYEIGYVFLKNGDYKKGIHYCLAVFSSPRALYYCMKKTLMKIKTVIMR
ncbi:glycosyltransferase family 2 protein [Ruminococcus sp.]|uniref:glycosyltransferase family 2 protein n=1 Tax=Ruminococcus sp. TaxID=41978 RepID=UPI0025DADD27|nr:glycosyltransferase family 2 protein [Ruminococcus sp.]